MNSLERASWSAASFAAAAIALAGLVAGGVRLLPWLLDPSVPWAVAEPFARGLAAVALESALLAGWPIGWSLACFRFVESGESRVFQTLGERPWTTVGRLKRQGAVFAAALAAVALLYGRDASAPGRVATELVERARASCEAARAPAAYSVPFTEFTWLCAGGRPARLAGPFPGDASASVLTAQDARIAGDFRTVELDDARVSIAGTPPVDLRARLLAVHGMAPWAVASSLAPAVRAVVLTLSAAAAAAACAYLVLLAAPRTRLGALCLGAAGPLAALGAMRILERAYAPPWSFAGVPVVAAGCPLLFARLILAARGLPRFRARRRPAMRS